MKNEKKVTGVGSVSDQNVSEITPEMMVKRIEVLEKENGELTGRLVKVMEKKEKAEDLIVDLKKELASAQTAPRSIPGIPSAEGADITCVKCGTNFDSKKAKIHEETKSLYCPQCNKLCNAEYARKRFLYNQAHGL